MTSVINSVLIVDDNRLPRMMERTILTTHFPDLSISEAACGEDALELARENSFDLALVDINMPGMDGIELVEWLRKEALVPHICFASANIQSYIKEKAKELDAHFIDKPLSEEKILTLMNMIENSDE